MQRIKYIKNYKDKKIGDIEMVGNNTAHGLIDKGIAVLYKVKIMKSPTDKMMRVSKRKYRTK